MKHRLSFILILILTFPMRFCSYKTIHRFGRFLGLCIYYCFPKYRKRTLSNLALASSLRLSEAEIHSIAKAALSNLMITCLEYAKFASDGHIHHLATCENPEEAARCMAEKKPVIFFCGHQANWEVLFLEATSRMPGVAIGRPIKNSFLYNWILRIREKYGGTIISPKNAVKEGLKGLKRGAFLGIVGDQGMPDSGYSSPFFGREAWTSPLPAILSYRTGSPLLVATTLRREGKYIIRYSDPLWPNKEAPMEGEVDRLMKAALGYLEMTITQEPGQWLWSHNRWKQQGLGRVKRQFRHDSILVILPKEGFDRCLALLPTLREIYPREFISIYAPEGACIPLEDVEIVTYRETKELTRRDFRFKLVFNFTNINSLKSHFKKLAAFEVVSLQDFDTLSPETLRRLVLNAE